jgi:7-carboxy-7-deazaguanine synthase
MSPPLRLVEHYSSIQGEGPRTGIPTQFVRFAGCNLRCPGWPCDTPYAINPSEWLSNSFTRSPEELGADVRYQAKSTGALNICLTGGEPFIQPADNLRTFAVEMALTPGYQLEVFTNGSQPLPEWAFRYAQVNMDWKLPGSGEAGKYDEENAWNARRLKPSDMIKLVCKHKGDFEEAVKIASQVMTYSPAQLWVGIVWNENYSTAQLVKDVQEHPHLNLHVNVQVHKFIWPRVQRGV